jgi:hypothetical protein
MKDYPGDKNYSSSILWIELTPEIESDISLVISSSIELIEKSFFFDQNYLKILKSIG